MAECANSIELTDDGDDDGDGRRRCARARVMNETTPIGANLLADRCRGRRRR